MLNWIKTNKKGIIRGMFLVPIILVMIISISHVVSWYNLSNPMSWAIYLSIAIEIAAMSSIAAASVRVRGGVWLVFFIVTLIQFIGNIFFSYKETDINSQDFKDWVELTGPLFESLGSDITDSIAQRRWLALLEGGLLPIISLASLHFFIKYGGSDDEKKIEEPIKEEVKPTPVVEEVKQQDVIEEKPYFHVAEYEKVMEEIREEELKEELKQEETPIVENITQPTPEPKEYDSTIHETIMLNAKKKAEGRDTWG